MWKNWKMVGRKGQIQETNLEILQWPCGCNLLSPLYGCCGKHYSILPKIPSMKDFWSQLQKAAWPKVMPSWASKGPPAIMTCCVAIEAWPSALNICLCLSTVLGPELNVESTEEIFGPESQFNFSPCSIMHPSPPFLKHHAQWTSSVNLLSGKQPVTISFYLGMPSHGTGEAMCLHKHYFIINTTND